MATVMLVNGVNISTCNAKFWSITPAARTVTNATEILDGASIPVMMDPAFGLKEYTLKLNVYGKNRKEIWENVSRVLQLFSKVATVELGGFYDTGRQRFFKLTLTKAEHTEYGPCQGRWHTLTLTCAGYEYGTEQIVNIAAYNLRVEDNGDGTGSASYTLSAESMSNQLKRTAIVPVNVTITQVEEELMEGDEFYVGVIGKKYPINADFRISGLCRTRMGKDMGSLDVSIYPDTHLYPGLGAVKVTLDGRNGKVTVDEENAGISQAVGLEMPAPMLFGFSDQEIKVEVTAYGMGKYKHWYNVGFRFVPIFL